MHPVDVEKFKVQSFVKIVKLIYNFMDFPWFQIRFVLEVSTVN